MPVLTVSGLSKTYASGFNALTNVSLEIRRGEIFALLGPNGAGKTTLINIICGIVRPSSGQITADGFDIAPAPGAEAPDCLKTPRLLDDGRTYVLLCTARSARRTCSAARSASE